MKRGTAPAASRRRRRRATRLALLSCAILGVALPAAAARPPLCPPGRFVVHAGARLLPGAALPRDVVLVEDGRAALVGACAPVAVRWRRAAAGTRVRARWPRGACVVPSRVRLRALVTDGCEVLRGTVRAAGRAPVALVAPRCADDAILGPGEGCAAPDACGPDAVCVDCGCRPRVGFGRDVVPLFAGCLAAACHVSATAPGGFDLSADAAHASLLGRAARAGACGGLPLVVPFRPDGSVLFARLSGTRCGTRMPPDSVPLPPDAVDAVRTWIAGGAPAD